MDDRERRSKAAALIAEITRRRGITPRWAPHEPHAKQAEFLALDCLEALYGGAAGGGKSDALLMAALQYVDTPGYAALLLRRTYADLALPGAIMDRAATWLSGTKAVWNGQDKRWTFPSGATLTFGYLDTEKDRFRYQGAEVQFLGFDELTQFPEAWYRYILSRLRRLQGSAVPLRARSASNPGGLGHDWVRRRFVDGNSDSGARFVPATLADNPHLDRESYERSLAQLDPITRRQLLDGVWVRDGAGLVYAHFDEVRNTVDAAPPLTNWLLGIDYGFNDDCAFSVVGWREHDRTVYGVESFKETGLTPSDAAERVVELGKRYDFSQIVADVGGLGKGYAEEARRRFSLPIHPAEKTNKRGYIDLLNGALAKGELKLAKGLTKPLVDEWLELPWNEARTKESDGFANHCADSMLYAWRAACAFHNEAAEDKPAPGTVEAIREDMAAHWEQHERDRKQAMRDEGDLEPYA